MSFSSSTSSSLTVHTTSSLDTSSYSDKSFNNTTKLTENIPNEYEFINIKTQQFSIGDSVKLIVDLDLFKQIQDQFHGGWNKKMSELIGKIGRVHRITDKGDVRVKYENEIELNSKWTIYANALNKVNLNFSIGDKVRINSDERIVKHLMKNCWNNRILTILGKFCNVTNIKPDGYLELNYKGFEFILNQECCYSILDQSLDVVDSTINNIQDVTKIMANEFKELGIEHKQENLNATIPDYLIRKCVSGNLKKVKEIIQKYPNIINEKSMGKTALHVSCHQGHKDIVKYLLESKADLEIKDFEGDTAIHYSCFSNQPEITDLLAQNKANVNLLNKNGCSPLHVAVNKLYVECVRVLLKNKCDASVQDSYGDTPFHDIIGKKVTKESLEIIDLLLEFSSFDLKLKNKRGFNLIHHACLKGNLIATEKILSKYPEMVNLQKDDGYSGLHLASLNGHTELVEYLIKNKADLELKTMRKQTALLLSIAQFHLPIIELLVENSIFFSHQILYLCKLKSRSNLDANVNVSDEDSDTGLHLILNEVLDKDSKLVQSPTKTKLSNLNQAMEKLCECKTICNVIETIPDNLKSNIRLIIAVYLLKNGANLYAKNKNQLTCLDLIVNENVKEFLKSNFSNLKDINQNNNHLYESFIEKLSNLKKCKLCDEEPVSVIFLPCNHKCVCLDCSIRIKKCIECSQVIKEKQASNGTNLTLNKIELSELLEKVKNLEEAQICSICMEHKKDTAFQCGHIVCHMCSIPLTDCHICRKKILTKIKIYEN